MVFLFLMLIFISFAAMCIYALVEIWKTQAKIEEKIENRNALFAFETSHFIGLPSAQGAKTKLYLYNDKILIEINNLNFNLDIAKLKDISIKSDSEIQNQYVSSVNKEALFGSFDSMVVARQNESKTVKYYLILTYCDNNEIKYIAFENNHMNDFHKFANEFKNISSNTVKSFDL